MAATVFISVGIRLEISGCWPQGPQISIQKGSDCVIKKIQMTANFFNSDNRFVLGDTRGYRKKK